MKRIKMVDDSFFFPTTIDALVGDDNDSVDIFYGTTTFCLFGNIYTTGVVTHIIRIHSTSSPDEDSRDGK